MFEVSELFGRRQLIPFWPGDKPITEESGQFIRRQEIGLGGEAFDGEAAHGLLGRRRKAVEIFWIVLEGDAPGLFDAIVAGQSEVIIIGKLFTGDMATLCGSAQFAERSGDFGAVGFLFRGRAGLSRWFREFHPVQGALRAPAAG